MVPISYVVGDVTEPVGEDRAVIVHVCNDVGAFGAGVALAVAERYPRAKARFVAWSTGTFQGGRAFRLGQLQWVGVGHDWKRSAGWPDRWVVNMVAQHGLRSASNPVPLRLEALEECLERLGVEVSTMYGPTSVHMPRIGCGLAGGKWVDVEPLVIKYLCELDVAVFVYDLGSDAQGGRGIPVPRPPKKVST